MKKLQRNRNGKAIRLSREILDLFPRSKGESFDKAFRRKLGITSKGGVEPEGIYWLLLKPRIRIFPSKAKALGASIMAMVGKGQQRKEMPKKVVVIK